VRNHINPPQGMKQRMAVRDIPFDEFRLGGKIARLSARMNPRLQAVEHTNLKTLFDETIHKVASNKARATDNKSTHNLNSTPGGSLNF
jgi:hypothetical protein